MGVNSSDATAANAKASLFAVHWRSKTAQEGGTALVYDKEMCKHRPLTSHDKNHPECPERIERIYSLLEKEDIVAKCHRIKPPRKAVEEELALVHQRQYIDKMAQIRNMSARETIMLEQQYNSVYLCPESYDTALLATGSVLQLVDAVCADVCRNGMAVIRPPGHHAEPDEANGFCIFNNVAVAAAYAIEVLYCYFRIILYMMSHLGKNDSSYTFIDFFLCLAAI